MAEWSERKEVEWSIGLRRGCRRGGFGPLYMCRRYLDNVESMRAAAALVRLLELEGDHKQGCGRVLGGF